MGIMAPNPLLPSTKTEKTDRDTSRSVTPVTVAGTAAAALSPYVLDENIKIFFAGKPAKTERDMSRSIFLVGPPYQYAGLDDKTFTKTLAEFVKQAQKQEEELDSTVYYKTLLSGYKSNRINWLMFSEGSSW